MRVLEYLGRPWVWLCTWVALLLCVPVQAQTLSRTDFLSDTGACLIRPYYPLPVGSAALQGLLELLDAAASECARNAPYHAWRGAVLLAQNAPADAAETLERALLLDPDLPGAQLDYAQALIAMGDTASAVGLLRQLQNRNDLPLYLRPLLDNELTALNPQAWRHRWTLSSAFGIDSNLNNAPAASQLTLTFPQGDITLPLAQSYQPHGGAAWLNHVQWVGARAAGEHLWLATAEVRARATADNAATGYVQSDFSVAWLQAPAAPAQWIGRAAMGRVDFGGQHLLDDFRVSALRQWRLDTCSAGLGMEAEQRHYPSGPELDGIYTGTLLTLQCNALPDSTAAPKGWSQQYWNVQMRTGRDHARHADRPGGRYHRTEWRAQWGAQFGAVQLAAEYGYTRQNDQQGYSPLLVSNLARRTDRHGVRLMLSYPLPVDTWGGAEAFVALDANAQASNIPAFASRQRALSAGLRWQLH